MNKIQRHIRSLIFILCLMVGGSNVWAQDSGNWTDYKASSFASGDGTSAAPYVIETAAQLAYFASQTGGGYYVLGADIDLAGHYWVPAQSTTCTFDGRGHTIKNMYVDWSKNATAGSSVWNGFGFFAKITTGIVKNIVFEDAVLEMKGSSDFTANTYLGVVAGSLQGNGSIYNIIIRSTDKRSAISDNNSTVTYNKVGLYAGGAVGYVSGGIIKNVVADVDVNLLSKSKTTPANVNVGNDNGVFIAGVVARVNNATYDNLWAMGTVTSTTESSTGTFSKTYLYSKVIYGAVIGGGSPINNDLYYKIDITISNRGFGSNNTGTSWSDINRNAPEFKNNANNNVNEIQNEGYFWDYKNSKFVITNILYNFSEETHTDKTKFEHSFTFTFGRADNTYTYEWIVNGVDGARIIKTDKTQGTQTITIPTDLQSHEASVKVMDGSNEVFKYEFIVSPETWGHFAASEFASGSGSQADPYIISNEAQLALLAKNVNSGTDYSGKYFKLTSDINLAGALWTPIGAKGKMFKGVFDGNGATISNCNVYVNGSGDFGLFGTIGGAENANAAVKNLIITNPDFKISSSVISDNTNIGSHVGNATAYSEISNIIMRNATINPQLSLGENVTGYTVNIGGVVGSVSSVGNTNYVLRNISSAATSADNTQNKPGNVSVNCGDIFGYLSSARNYPIHLYSEHSAFYGANSGLSYDESTWKTSGAEAFVTDVNSYIESTDDESLLYWKSADGNYSFIGFSTLTLTQTNVNTITANVMGATGETVYTWQTSTDGQTWTEVADNNTNPLVIDHSPEHKTYVKVSTVNPESISKILEVEQLIATAKITSSGSTANVAVTNNLWSNNDNLTITYQWCTKTVTGSGDDEVVSYTPISGETNASSSNSSASACIVEVRANGVLILRQTLYKPTVIYLHPANSTIQGHGRGNDNNNGLTPGTAVRTWKKAYSLLLADGTVESNIIVLMGVHDHNNTDMGLSQENSLQNQANTTDKLSTWENNVPAVFKKAATITGKYNDVDYQGEYVMDGGTRGKIFGLGATGGCYIGIFADTKFEHLIFTQVVNGSLFKDQDRNFCGIFAQYHNLTMGDGLIMREMEIAKSYGQIAGSMAPDFQIFGGFNNDARFTGNYSAMDNDAYFPKKGFTIDIRSGYYSIICAGGRQSSASTNGVYGTPTHPVKCTINIDINRNHNDLDDVKNLVVGDDPTLNSWSMTEYHLKNHYQPDYDISLILAGTHEGAMYGDVDIVVKSGNVARITNGTLGARTAIGSFPFNSYMGRASILLDPEKSEMNTNPDINSRVLVTEIYGGSVGRASGAAGMIDVPFLGESSITINGGTIDVLNEKFTNNTTIMCGVYGAGMGGVNGVGTSDYNGYTTGTSRTNEYPYWNGNSIVYGDASSFLSATKRVEVTPHDANGNNLTPIDLQFAKSVITINGGVFGTQSKRIDGIFGGGSGFTSTDFLTSGDSYPNTKSGNLYGDIKVNINGGTFYCDIYGAGRGSAKYVDYSGTWSGLTKTNYAALGQTYGNVEVNITGGTINGSVFGAGAGVQNRTQMAEVIGKTSVNISGNPTITGSVYGGAALAVVSNGEKDATDVSIGGTADIGGSVYAAGNGRANGVATNNNNHDEGKVFGNASISIQDSPSIAGDIYGGAAFGDVKGNTSVSVNDTPTLSGNIYGGGSGDSSTATSADVSGNTTVTVNGANYASANTLYYIYGGGNIRSAVAGNTNVTIGSPKSVNAQVYVYGGGNGTNTSCANTNVTINPFTQPEGDSNLYGLGDVFGGGNAGTVAHKATVLLQGGTILGDVFGGGNAAVVGTNGDAVDSEGKKTDGTQITMTGTNSIVYGNIYGGGNQANVNGSTLVQLTKGNFAGDVFGGGNGVLDANNVSVKAADISHNTEIYVEGAKVVWDRRWLKNTLSGNTITAPGSLISWNKSAADANFFTGTAEAPVFITNHNIYGGGNNSCNVLGTATVRVTDGFAGYDILSTDIWKNAYNDNANPHFYVFGGGFGPYTTVNNTIVNVGMEATPDEDATTDEQLAKSAGIALGAKNKSPRRRVASGEGTDDAEIGVYDNRYGFPDYTVLGVVGGGYAGLIKENTDVTVGGSTFIHRVYGGGFGQLAAYNSLSTDPDDPNNTSRKLRDVLGEVGINTDVKATGAYIYGDIFGGGAGVESLLDGSGKPIWDFVNMGRVLGKTKVTVSDKAIVYGNVYGGGDVANVGTNVKGTGDPGTTGNARTYVNVIGGNIFGEVFAGGNGRLKTQAVDYTTLGRVEGNALLVVDNSIEGEGENAKSVKPYIWQRIYGGGQCGTVNGNTLVHVKGGNIGSNIFGGGLGDEGGSNHDGDDPSDSSKGTYANVLGNTNITIDGGSIIWDKVADIDGNVSAWEDALLSTGMSIDELLTMRAENENLDISALIASHVDSKFFTFGNGFVTNHNIYGGGRYACHVGTYNGTAIEPGTGVSTVTLNHSIVDDANLLDATKIAGLCWYSVIDNKTTPQFSVFGGGYGANTKVGSTLINAQMDVDDAWNTYDNAIKNAWNNVSASDKASLYGGDDENSYRRYRVHRYAWSIGVPSHTYLNYFGGGYSGYVVGNTEVNISDKSGCRNVFGGGLGAVTGRSVRSVPSIGSASTFGEVGGNTEVNITGAIVSLDVFGGGAGVESTKIEGTLTDFPHMARVKGTTSVVVNGAVDKTDMSHPQDQVLIYGHVYGGGDVANVLGGGTITGTGFPAATPATDMSTGSPALATNVSVLGGVVLSAIHGGGNGRSEAECNDYKLLGSIYGNTKVQVTQDSDHETWLLDRIYGGGENGTVYGNTFVDIQDGHFAEGLYGGGLGNVDENANVTSADVTGNTRVNISGGEMELSQIWNPGIQRSWVSANEKDGNLYSSQYDPELRKFKVNHNIYGGGNVACVVGGSTYVDMTKGMIPAHPSIGHAYANGGNFFHENEWKEVYYKIGSSHFSVFGGGYGANTQIDGDTYVNINLPKDPDGADINPDGTGIETENLYSHYYPNQTVMDVIGGGYSGPVIGSTHVTIGGNTFCRRVFGGGFYAPVGYANVQINSVDCNDIFGGGLMGDINNTAVVNLGSDLAQNTKINVHQNIYGGNDVSGDIKSSTTLNLYGGHVFGNVYGAGNGNYLYAVGREKEQIVTAKEYYKTATNTYDLVYAVPSRRFMASVAASTPAQRMVNCSSYRPEVQDVYINMKGKAGDIFKVDGSVFGGGNSATVNNITAEPSVTFNFGSYISLGNVYMGCDGDAMFDDTKQFRKAFEDVNSLNLEDDIDWQNDPANHAITTQFLPVEHEDRDKIFKHLFDLYFQPVEMSVQPKVYWGDTFTNSADETVSNITIGSFVCGGNRGNMDVRPDADGKIVDYHFPNGVTILDKIVGGCSNANYQMPSSETKHEGGYLLGVRGKNAINLDIYCDFAPQVGKNGVMEGGNVYGGCYTSGTVAGDVYINMKSDMLANITHEQLEATKAKDLAVCSVYGAGFGSDSYVRGNTNIELGNGVKKTDNNGNGSTANFIFGGGQQGSIIGNSTVHVYNGHVASSVCGGSYAGFMWGSTQLLIGYPKYYKVQKSGIYKMLRTDKWNLATGAIKQSINLMEGDIISREVYDAIAAYNGEGKVDNLAAAFGTEQTSGLPAGLSWDDIDIKIDEAVYGGGYSLASGSSVAAGTYTVKKYDSDQNLNEDLTTDEIAALDNGEDGTVSYGGNTTVLVWDAPTSNSGTTDHIAVSSQTMKTATLKSGTDLFGYYYKNTDGNYQSVSKAGKYAVGGVVPENQSTSDKNFYQYDGEGGLYGDGHLSFAEGFRSADVYGYGFAGSSPKNAKIINTFQRMDMLRLTDCAVVLLGARDYTVNEISTTPYSIARVDEIQMMAENVTNVNSGTLAALSSPRSRNYLGLSNNVHYCGAVYSNVAFTDTYRDASGVLGSGTYREKKQDFITNHKSDNTFEQRNDGTAANMIGIASGYALKIQNLYKNEGTESMYYGPVVGVVEVALVNVDADEGGGYVYADNIHHRNGADVPVSSVDAEDFLETSGNFVYPHDVSANRYLVDDCFPIGYDVETKGHGANGVAVPEAHYWYVTGWNYYFNVNITGYTYDSADRAITFDSDNLDGLVQLYGAQGQDLNLQSMKWLAHETEGCDLETPKPSGTHDTGFGNNKGTDGHYDHYNLHLSVSAEDNGYNADSDKSSCYNYLPMTESLDNDNRPIANKWDDACPSVYFQLSDKVDNSGEEYYNNYMSEPCQAIIELTAPDPAGSGNHYTYTINLTISYVQGPNVTGHLSVENCALPGERIKIGKGDIRITADKSMSQSATYYRIGPRVYNETTHKWEFKKDADNNDIYYTYDISKPYDAEAADNTTSEMLSGVEYDTSDTQNPYLLVPAYYFMNGYGVQYCFEVSGIDNTVFDVDMTDDNKLVVHNYHRMQPRLAGGDNYTKNLYIDLAAKRAAEAGSDLPEPRIYIEDAIDLNKFGEFLNEKSDAEAEVGSRNDFGNHMQFFIQNDIASSGYSPAANFKGKLHGDGHVISGMTRYQYLFDANNGHIYNLGLVNGSIAAANEKNGKYHCCFEHNPSSGASVVYRIDGGVYRLYNDDDWRYGKVAFDLNQYYLDKRYGGESIADSYVEDYYSNGDYLYASYSVENHFNNSEYLRTSSVPSYDYASTAHNMAHTIDQSRAVDYVAATGDAPESCTGYHPLFDAAKITESVTLTDIKNDYIFFGQVLNKETESAADAAVNMAIPGAIAVPANAVKPGVHLTEYMSNRVYRAGGFYNSKINNGFYYNKEAYVFNNGITAIDFYGYKDLRNGDGTKKYGGYSPSTTYFGGNVGSSTGTDINYYTPVCDSYLTKFTLAEGVTRNLLVYAATQADVTGLYSAFGYDADTPESEIKAHIIEPDAGNPKKSLFHLVERSDESQPNNDFNAPVAFSVTDKAWYTRVPAYYAEMSNSAWEGISLPFSVNRVEASVNGEISHFYGSAEATQGANQAATTNTGHEYWLRGLSETATPQGGSGVNAVFKRPGIFTVEGHDVTGSYTYSNTYFRDTYGDVYGGGDIYAAPRTYDGYNFQSAYVPYIVSFPGSVFKEFDLSGGFNATLMSLDHEVWDADNANHSFSGLNTTSQTVTFSWLCTNDNVTDAKGTATIAVTDDALVVTNVNGYKHKATFARIDDALYGMNPTGTAFDRGYNDVLPFRTYMVDQYSNAKGGSIFIFEETGIEELPQNEAEESEVKGLRIYSKDRRIIVESPTTLTLDVHTTAGQLVRVCDVKPGTNTYSGFANGIYVIGKKKLYVK